MIFFFAKNVHPTQDVHTTIRACQSMHGKEAGIIKMPQGRHPHLHPQKLMKSHSALCPILVCHGRAIGLSHCPCWQLVPESLRAIGPLTSLRSSNDRGEQLFFQCCSPSQSSECSPPSDSSGTFCSSSPCSTLRAMSGNTC